MNKTQIQLLLTNIPNTNTNENNTNKTKSNNTNICSSSSSSSNMNMIGNRDMFIFNVEEAPTDVLITVLNKILFESTVSDVSLQSLLCQIMCLL